MPDEAKLGEGLEACMDWLFWVGSPRPGEKAPPVPCEALARVIREDGSLDKVPALALLDEIAYLRSIVEMRERDVPLLVAALTKAEQDAAALRDQTTVALLERDEARALPLTPEEKEFHAGEMRKWWDKAQKTLPTPQPAACTHERRSMREEDGAYRTTCIDCGADCSAPLERR